MSNVRRNFLTRFFALLDENGVRYCMLRNYDNMYDGDSATDLDMIVSQYSLTWFERSLREAAEQTGFRLVHTARYVNYSHVFWHPQAGFVRVDFETDVRWRLFTVLEAREVLDARVRHQEFFIPHPAHESVIIYIAAIWRGELSERYRSRLSVLYAACPDKNALRQILIGAFGHAGHTLARMQEVANQSYDRRFSTWLRLSIIFRSQLIWPRLLGVMKNLEIDSYRFIERVSNCAGVSLIFVSSNTRPPDFIELQRRIEFLFPIKKCVVQTIDLRRPVTDQVGWWMRWKRLFTMFKGGLFVRAYQVAEDRDWFAALQPHARHMYSGRSFVCVEDSLGKFYFAHVKSGIMNLQEAKMVGENPKEFSRLFIEFMSNVLERSQRAKQQPTHRPGKFCVLVGLDGTGKTTLARNLAGLASQEWSLAGIRYFHWLPGWRRSFTCPLPESGNQPRKPRRPGGFGQATLSVIRLVRNLIRARLAWRLRLRSFRDRGYLVLVDRYFYNYYLDPVSVKYYGPRWVLDLLSRWFPKPEIVITLSAPAEVLLQRKQELTAAEMREQAAALKQLKFPTPHLIAADAREPAATVANKVMAELRKIMA
jgi:thymidylate kinase